jgi:molybdopterin-containing oxidoreductase family iron-sulfur binding subunit
MNDENSKVSQYFRKDPRAYTLLEEWHAAPSVRYMTKIRNNHQEARYNKDSADKANKGDHA